MRTVSEMAARYVDAEQCECGALIEEIDNGDGFSYWAHVKRMRIAYDHAAVPCRVGVRTVLVSIDSDEWDTYASPVPMPGTIG